MVQFKSLDNHYWGKINEHLQIIGAEDTVGLVAVDDDTDEVLCAAVFDNYTGRSVQAHLLIRDYRPMFYGWWDRIRAVMFEDLGVKLVYGFVPGDNEKALKLNKKLGFTEKCRLEEAFAPGVDYVMMELRKEDFRYGKKEPRR